MVRYSSQVVLLWSTMVRYSSQVVLKVSAGADSSQAVGIGLACATWAPQRSPFGQTATASPIDGFVNKCKFCHFGVTPKKGGLQLAILSRVINTFLTASDRC